HGRVLVIDRRTHAVAKTLEPSGQALVAFALSPAGDRFLAGYALGLVSEFDVAAMEFRRNMNLEGTSVQRVAYVDASRAIATVGTEDGSKVVVLDVTPTSMSDPIGEVRRSDIFHEVVGPIVAWEGGSLRVFALWSGCVWSVDRDLSAAVPV